MSSLIPFEHRAPSGRAAQSPANGPKAPIVDVSSVHGPRSRVPASRRRPRRNWDPAFHVDLLTF